MNEHEYNLEEIVDAIGLTVAIELLSRICYGKAEHLRSAWQDEKTARIWTRDAKRLDRTAFRLEN